MVSDQTRPQRWGPLTGLAFVVILVVSFLIVSTPGSGDSGAKVIAWYSNSANKRAANISSLLIDLAIVFGLFFFGYLRDRLRNIGPGQRLAPVMFGGAVMFAAGGLLASGTTFALTDVPKKLTPASAQALNVVSNDLPFPLITIGVAVLTFATGLVIVRSRTLPVWVGWLSLVIGVVGVLGPIGFFAFLATGIWILILCYLLYREETAKAQPRIDLAQPVPQAVSEAGASAPPGAVVSGSGGPGVSAEHPDRARPSGSE
jgi:hypothetical protein